MTKISHKNVLRRYLVFTALYVGTIGIVLSVFILHPSKQYNLGIMRNIIVFFSSVLLMKYFVYMFVSPWYDVVAHFFYSDESAEYNPKVSVMIPAWNEEVGILSTVRSVLKSNYKNIEVIVVNDGSTDRSDKLMRDFVAKRELALKKHDDPMSVVYHYKQNAGKGEALNTAISLATGDILISIDADCIVTENAIGSFVKYFRNPEVMAAVGNVKIGNTDTIVGVVQNLEFLFSFYFKKADSVMNTIYIIGGAAGAFRREVFEQLGNYHSTNITEDIDLSVRIQNAGMKIVYAADALVYTEGAVDIRGLMKQRLRWKRGRFQTFNEYRHLFFSGRKHHNKILTFVILPLAMFGELQLFLEIWFVLFLYVYSYIVRDFSSFISGIVVVSFMFFVQSFFNDKQTRRFSFILLSPIGWLLFYVATFVEFNALIRSIWGALTKKEVKWQKWQRNGLYDSIKAENIV